MKIMKNKFFKIASLMIMLCLISTCAIGTTFAKYVTGDTVGDSARVAKWGIVLEMQFEEENGANVEDTLFDTEYSTDDNNYSGSLSVKASSDENVVAPGTSGSTRFSISGTPEVAARIEINFDITSDIVLPAGFVNGQTDAYYPLVFTLTQTDSATGVVMASKSGTLEEIQDFLDDYSGAEYAPNTNLSSAFELSWAWDYSVDDVTDEMDTLLGDIIAGTKTAPAGTSTAVEYTLTITVTQID